MKEDLEKYDGQEYKRQAWYLNKIYDLCRSYIGVKRNYVSNDHYDKITSQKSLLEFFFGTEEYDLLYSDKKYSSNIFNGSRFIFKRKEWKKICQSDNIKKWINDVSQRVFYGCKGFKKGFPSELSVVLEMILKNPEIEVLKETDSNIFTDDEMYLYCKEILTNETKEGYCKIITLLMIYLVYSYRVYIFDDNIGEINIATQCLQDFTDSNVEKGRVDILRCNEKLRTAAYKYRKDFLYRFKLTHGWEPVYNPIKRKVELLDIPATLSVEPLDTECPLDQLIRQNISNNIHVLLCGENGIGKTSAMLMAWYQLIEKEILAIYVSLDKRDNFNLRSLIETEVLNQFFQISTWEIFVQSIPSGSRPVLLLAGFDHLSFSSKKTVTNEIRFLLNQAMIVVESRNPYIDRLPAELLIKARLKGIEREQIEKFLNRHGICYFPKDKKLLKLLSNSLLLNLYAQTKRNESPSSCPRLIHTRTDFSSSSIIWNYLESQIVYYYEQQDTNAEKTEIAIIAIEFILPYFAYQLNRRHRISKASLREYMDNAFNYFCNGENGEAFRYIEKRIDSITDYSNLDKSVFMNYIRVVIKILIDELHMILKYKNHGDQGNDEYFLFHPEFCDCLSAISLNQQAMIVCEGLNNSIPKAWNTEVFSLEIFYHLERFIDKELLEKLWGRIDKKNTYPTALKNIFELLRRKNEGQLYRLDFSDKDLTEISLLGCDLVSGKIAATFENSIVSDVTFLPQGHNGKVRSVSIDSKSRYVATSSDDGDVLLWNISTGLPQERLKGHESVVRRIVFTNGGTHLISCSSDKTIRLWEIQGEKKRRVFIGPQKRIRSIACSPDDTYIGCGSDDGKVYLWELNQINIETEQSFRPGNKLCKITSMNFIMSRKQLLIGDSKGNLYIWDTESNNCLWKASELDKHTCWINSTAIDPKGRYFVTSSDDETLRLWVNEGFGASLKQIVPTAGYWISSISFNPDGSEFITGASNGEIRIWQIKDRLETQLLAEEKNWVESVCYSKDGNYIITGSSDGMAKIRNTADNSIVHTLIGNAAGISALAYGRQESGIIVSGSYDGYVSVWNTMSQFSRTYLQKQEFGVCSIDVTYDQSYIVSGNLKGQLYIWEFLNEDSIPRTITIFSTQIKCISCSPNSYEAALCSSDSTIEIWDILKECRISKVEDWGYRIRSICYDQKGNLIISGSSDGYVRIWDISNRQFPYLKHCFIASEEGIRVVDFIGEHLYTGSDDGFIKIWTLVGENITLINEIKKNNRWINCFSVSPEEHYIVSDSKEGGFLVWDLLNQKYKEECHNYPKLFIGGCNFRGVQFKDTQNMSSGELKKILEKNGGIM